MTDTINKAREMLAKHAVEVQKLICGNCIAASHNTGLKVMEYMAANLPTIAAANAPDLVWVEGSDGDYSSHAVADNERYDYSVGRCDYGWFFVEHLHGHEGVHHYPKEEAAQDAANNHYRTALAMALGGDA